MSFQMSKNLCHHRRSNRICRVTRCLWALTLRASNKRRRNNLSRTITLTANERKSTSNCKSIYKIKFLLRATMTIMRALFNLSSKSRAFIFILSSSIFRNSALIKHILFFSLIVILNSRYKSSKSNWKRTASTSKINIIKKSFKYCKTINQRNIVTRIQYRFSASRLNKNEKILKLNDKNLSK